MPQISPFVRAAQADDLSALPDLERRAATRFADLGYPEIAALPVQSLDALRSACADGRLLVAQVVETGELVGFALLEPAGDDLHLVELDVERSWQGRGVGRALLDATIAHAAGFRRVTLTTYRDVPFNAPFYARYGFLVLDDHTMGPRLSALRDAERTHGFDILPRVAMAWELR